jgi:P27 family predicted phage terminase small subunit
MRVLRGNPSKRAVNDAEPTPHGSNLKPPTWLPTGQARKFWAEFAPMLQAMRVLTEADEANLAALCAELARYVEASKVIANGGLTYTITTKNGSEYQATRPEVSIANAALQNVLRLSDRFGLNPSARSRIKVEADEAVDPLDELRRATGRA